MKGDPARTVTRAQGAGPEGQGQLDRQPGLFGALQVRLPAFPALFGPRVQPWDSCPPGLMPCPRAGGNGLIPGYWGAGGGVTVLIGTTPHPCPAPQLLCPPGIRQRVLTSVQRPTLRAKGHQTTCLERQAPRVGVGGGGTGLLREATPCGYLIPPGGMPAPELSPQPIPCHSA